MTPGSDSLAALRETVAAACRILGAEGLAPGVLGHVSVRTGDDEMLIRCRGPWERGVRFTLPCDIRRVSFSGDPLEEMDGTEVPKELPIHGELYRSRPEVTAVVHAHPHAALLAGLAGLRPRAVFGAYNMPAMRLARDGVPVYPRPVLITRADLAVEMVDAMGDRPVCLLRGHGVTVVGDTVEQATVRAVNLTELYQITVELAQLGVAPEELSAADLAELPNLGSRFDDSLAWNALRAREGES
jgi:3,4-dihydroxyphthalate decarboxylase